MPLTLSVDGPRWRAHQAAVAQAMPGLVPVVKGNGYGFGLALLAAEAARLGTPTLAVGRPAEVDDVRAGGFTGDVLVLEPWLPEVDGDPAGESEGVVLTASTPEGLRALAGRRVVVELLSSMRRFGLTAGQLAESSDAARAVRLEGIALHLPLATTARGHVAESTHAVRQARDAGLTVDRLWVSHLTAAELEQVRAAHPDVDVRPRIGTQLWLGDRDAAQARATVLATHAVGRGERYGYRQRRASRAGTLVVVAGGTSHGIAMSAPTAAQGVGQRAKALAVGGLEAVGRSLSPYHVGGAQRWFAEPPHMQVSMLWLPSVEPVPAVGSELDVDVRMTTTTFDRVVVS